MREPEIQYLPLSVMLMCNLYGMLYDMTQMYKQKWLYFFDLWNFNDQLYIWIGFVNILI
jgi:hypothetical protein